MAAPTESRSGRSERCRRPRASLTLGVGRIGLLVDAAVAASCCLAAGLGLASCWSLSEPLPVTQTGAEGGSGATATAGGGGTAGTGGAGGAEPCVPAEPPAAPGSAGGSSAGGWVFAFRTVRFDSGPGDPIGYDLDGTCTCPGPTTCVANVDAGAHCDGPGGRDNTLGPALDSTLGLLLPSPAADLFSTAAETGEWTLLLEVEQLSTPDDPQVQVVARPAAACCGGSGPTWNGADPWPADEAIAAVTADEAYLASDRLVARFATLEIHLRHLATPLLRISLRMRDAVLTASLQSSPPPARLIEGVVTGQVSEADLFWGLESIQSDVYALCRDNQFYSGIKDLICDARDLSTAGSGAPCERASFALGFTADEVGAGASAAVAPKNGCISGEEPLGDTCD